MNEILKFAGRNEFRVWLQDHCLSDDGVWLLFGKPGGPKTIKAAEALEEALCFGWIDGQMQSIEEKTYRKYFSKRRENRKWSEAKTDAGREKRLMWMIGRLDENLKPM